MNQLSNEEIGKEINKLRIELFYHFSKQLLLFLLECVLPCTIFIGFGILFSILVGAGVMMLPLLPFLEISLGFTLLTYIVCYFRDELYVNKYRILKKMIKKYKGMIDYSQPEDTLNKVRKPIFKRLPKENKNHSQDKRILLELKEQIINPRENDVEVQKTYTLK